MQCPLSVRVTRGKKVRTLVDTLLREKMVVALSVLLHIHFHDLLTLCILFHHRKLSNAFLPGVELEDHDLNSSPPLVLYVGSACEQKASVLVLGVPGSNVSSGLDVWGPRCQS